MPSPFAAAMSAAAAIHDAVMGEWFEYRPMAASFNPNNPPAADPDRAIVPNLRAVFGEVSARVFSGPVRTTGVGTERPGLAATRSHISLQLSLLPYAPRVKDRVWRTASGALYQVAEILPSEPGYVRLDLNLIKAA